MFQLFKPFLHSKVNFYHINDDILNKLLNNLNLFAKGKYNVLRQNPSENTKFMKSLYFLSIQFLQLQVFLNVHMSLTYNQTKGIIEEYCRWNVLEKILQEYVISKQQQLSIQLGNICFTERK